MDGGPVGVDLALGSAADDVAEEVAAVGDGLCGADAAEGVAGDAIEVPVGEELAELTALVLLVGGLVGVDGAPVADDADTAPDEGVGRGGCAGSVGGVLGLLELVFDDHGTYLRLGAGWGLPTVYAYAGVVSRPGAPGRFVIRLMFI